ncbi:MAG: phosphoribosylaminoimidazolesuccinocarboxamide synthase [Patescibacteria group bacterium]
MQYLSEEEARELVRAYMAKEGEPVTAQDILNAGVFPILNGFVVKPGKVSDCINGGEGEFIIPADKEPYYLDQLRGLPVEFTAFTDTADDNKPKVRVSFKNPPLLTRAEKIPGYIMLRSNRLSTHDIGRGRIPFNDQVLALNHDHMRRLVTPFFPSSQFELGLPPGSVVIASEQVTGMDFENVLRAFMAKTTTETSLYHAYMNQKLRKFAGYDLPDDLYPNGPTPSIYDTPSTKSASHDVTVEPGYLFKMKICTPVAYFRLRNKSLAAFGAVMAYLLERGIILVDVKTEHGYNYLGVLCSKDELYTMNSARYWDLVDYLAQEKLFLAGDESGLVEYLQRTQPGITEKDYVVNSRVIIVPKSFSKEFARDMSKGKEGYSDEQRAAIAIRYIMGIQHLLQQRFEPDLRPWHERVETDLREVISQLF